MEHWAAIYYTFCPRLEETAGNYLKFQRKIADRMLKYVFLDKFGVEYTQENVKKGVYGKPCWNGNGTIYFNVSNTDGLVVCAVSDVEIGVDTEKIKEMRFPVMKRCCVAEEINYIKENRESFFRIWTLKESYIKMIGEGLHFPLKKVSFSIMEKGDLIQEEIVCNQSGFFSQRKVSDYWISLCTEKRAAVKWQEI